MYLGITNKKICKVSKQAPNQSVCLTGVSGTGKTTKLYQMEMACAKDGDTVLVIDINQTHQNEQIMNELKEKNQQKVNRISAIRDGLGIELLSFLKLNAGEEESYVHLINSAVNAFSVSYNMGIRQIGALRKAIIEAVEHKSNFATEADAIASCLAESEDDFAQAVYEKLWTVLKCGALRPCSKFIQAGKINIIDMSGNDSLTQMALTELLLADIWRKVQFQKSYRGQQNLVIVIDEFQELLSKKSEMLKTLLCQGRKFGISMLIATQTLSVFKRETIMFLNQTATRLYFRPALSEVARVAKEISMNDSKKVEKVLRNLRVGEALAVGDLCIDGMEICKPIILR